MTSKWLCFLGVILAFLQPASAEYAEIVIDGDFSDWGSMPSVTNDALDNVTGVDYKEMWVANDNDYLYIRYTLHAFADPFTWQTHVFIDGDNNKDTGWHPSVDFGTEVMVENNLAYQSAGGVFNEGELAVGVMLQRPESGSVTQLEFRISRAVAGVSNAYENVSLISSDTIRILLQDARGSELMPDDAQGVAYTFAPPPAPPSCYKKITIDGVFSDWEGVPSVAVLPSSNPGFVDWKEMWLANDENYFYIKYTLHEAANPHTSQTSFFFDGDNNKESGFDVSSGDYFGSEFFVQGGGAYQDAGGGWNEGTLANASPLQSPFNTEAKEFEFRVARVVTGVSGAFEGQPLFTSDTIRILPYTNTSEIDKFMPHKKGAIYAFAPKPPPQGTLIRFR